MDEMKEEMEEVEFTDSDRQMLMLWFLSCRGRCGACESKDECKRVYNAIFVRKANLFSKVNRRGCCEICGYVPNELDGSLVVHHINLDKKDSQSQNFMLLCKSCHGKFHYVY